tara:strand:+ start:5037 stop:5291 length:255 start_codon:yes stop_codon:yes gene_type:complete
MFDGPFGVSCTAGSTTANGILDEPTSVVAGDQVLYVDRVLHCAASSFGTLVGGDAITVDGVNYKVRTNEKDLDGLSCQISLEKV